MIDQIIIGDKASYDDFGASLAKRNNQMPSKKSIKETVPFSNVTYDFSAINGELYWEERELEYIFEMFASTPEKLEEMKIAFSDWVMNILEEKLIDPLNPDYHYLATFDDMSYADEETLDKTTVTVKFTAYPYKISNVPRVYKYELAAGEEINATLINDSSHKVTPTINSDIGITIIIGNDTYVVSAGELTDESIKLDKGINTITFKNAKTEVCTLTVSFNIEVF